MLGTLRASCAHPKPAASHILPTISTSINTTLPQFQGKFSSKANELEPKSSKDARPTRLWLLTTNFCTLPLTAEQMGRTKPHQYPAGRKKITSSQSRQASHSPPGRDGDAHKGFVPQQLPVKLLEVLELPFHLPCELPVGQLDGVHVRAWHLRGRTTQLSPPPAAACLKSPRYVLVKDHCVSPLVRF